MRTRVATRISLLIVFAVIQPSWNTARGYQENGYGPEVKSFLDLMKHEETELEFQIRHNEIARKDYLRSKSRIAIMRNTVLSLVKETGEDRVPELHVVAAAEIGQLIEDGPAVVKGIKPGEIIKEKWRYIGKTTRGELFYIFERLSAK
jgi:hypothetical protein